MWVAGNQRHFEWMVDMLSQIESIVFVGVLCVGGWQPAPL